MTIRWSSAGKAPSHSKMLEDAPELDVLVIPIGGGGLIAGNVIAARARKSTIEIVGAEAALYPSFWNALYGENLPLGGATLAEGIAVKNVGVLALPIVRELVSDIVLVDEAHLERAVNAYLTLQKTMAEGAGGAGVPPLLPPPPPVSWRQKGPVLFGGNIDPPPFARDHAAPPPRAGPPLSFWL